MAGNAKLCTRLTLAVSQLLMSYLHMWITALFAIRISWTHTIAFMANLRSSEHAHNCISVTSRLTAEEKRCCWCSCRHPVGLPLNHISSDTIAARYSTESGRFVHLVHTPVTSFLPTALHPPQLATSASYFKHCRPVSYSALSYTTWGRLDYVCKWVSVVQYKKTKRIVH